MSVELFTVGHSSHLLEHFLALLQQHRIIELVDIRSFPGSRHFPQFNREHLAASLQDSGIEYHWIEALGGRRPKAKAAGPSPNLGLRNQSFRNYADYMQTDAFRQGIDSLLRIAQSKRTAFMCAESVFWRCHRKLVSDYVLAGGGTVQHIFPDGSVKPHALTTEAKVEAGRVTYPEEKTLFD